MCYFENKCGKLISCDQVESQVLAVLGCTETDLVNSGLLTPVEPSVEDCIRSGNPGLAIIRYQQLHNSDITEAFDAVMKIKKGLK